jgi:hypothetical protein
VQKTWETPNVAVPKGVEPDSQRRGFKTERDDANAIDRGSKTNSGNTANEAREPPTLGRNFRTKRLEPFESLPRVLLSNHCSCRGHSQHIYKTFAEQFARVVGRRPVIFNRSRGVHLEEFERIASTSSIYA